MRHRLTAILYTLALCFSAPWAWAQVTCTTLGQNPSTAFPVCGTSTFAQASVPTCGDRRVPGPCNNVPLTDKNPFWYKFTCFTSGTLGFVITPNSLSSDYDWQLFDITNRNPNDVYTNPSLFVACNWSGDPGLTGASAAGQNVAYCDGPGVPRFSRMPQITAGRTYILLVSHFSDSQSGYSLEFTGGTASITDPLEPLMQSTKAACDGARISVKINKRIKCTSISTNGSEFALNSPLATITGAIGVDCTNGFDTDSLVLTLSNPLPPGTYRLRIRLGGDANTLLDNCDRGIAVDQELPVVVLPVLPTPLDSITKPACAPTTLSLVFRDPMRCNSIAADGSDFVLTGPNAPAIVSATASCTNGLANSIQINLATPIQTAGNYQVAIRLGSDGNTLINECNVPTPVGSQASFQTADTVNARFTWQILNGCESDTIRYQHPARNGVNSWRWTFDVAPFNSTQQNPQVGYTTAGDRTVSLTVSNGTCSNTYSETIRLDTALRADFEHTLYVCPGERAQFQDRSAGNPVSWTWIFGNGNRFVGRLAPDQTYSAPLNNSIRDVQVQLIVTDQLGCRDTATKTIQVPGNCFIAVPKAFTPNRDGLNDFLYPTNAYKARDLRFRIFNRAGQLIFETRDWMKRWDGTFQGNPQDPGAYVWTLEYTLIDTGQRIVQRGSTLLLR